MNDQFNPVGGAMKIVEHAPQARMVLVNRCGHWVQVEHREMFNRAIASTSCAMADTMDNMEKL